MQQITVLLGVVVPAFTVESNFMGKMNVQKHSCCEQVIVPCFCGDSVANPRQAPSLSYESHNFTF